jgi:hypothetical protein
MSNDSDSEEFDFEKISRALDIRLKQAELALKQAELKAKDHAGLSTFTASPLNIAVMTGVLGLIAAGIGNFVQDRANLRLEQKKAETSLILKAIETGDAGSSAKNLLFLVKMV